jgi:hypothetical protein
MFKGSFIFLSAKGSKACLQYKTKELFIVVLVQEVMLFEVFFVYI